MIIRLRFSWPWFAAVFALIAPGLSVQAEAVAPRHGASMYGDLIYGPYIQHLEYANPAPPKVGTLTLSAIGSFAILNPYTLLDTAAAGSGLLFETLSHGTLVEPCSEYGLLAASV